MTYASEMPLSVILEKILGQSVPDETKDAVMDIPDVAENGALVPVMLRGARDTDRVYLLAEGNPGPLLAEFHFHHNAVPAVAFRVKLNQTGPVQALVHGSKGWVRSQKTVKIAIGGCG